MEVTEKAEHDAHFSHTYADTLKASVWGRNDRKTRGRKVKDK